MSALVTATNSAASGDSIGRRTDDNFYRVADAFTYNAAWGQITGATMALLRAVSVASRELTVRIETDSGGVPSGTLANSNATATIANFTTATFVTKTVSFNAFPLVPGTQYWMVIKFTTESGGSAGTDDYYRDKFDNSTGTAGKHASWGGSSWLVDGTSFTGEFSILGDYQQGTFLLNMV